MIRGFVLAVLLVIGGASAKAQNLWPGFYPEGPVWIDDSLYWAEMQSDTVFRLGENGPEPFFEARGCGPTALARYRTDDLIVLCHLSGRLMHLSADGNQIAEIAQAADGTRLRDPNDASADGNGGVWFTDPGRFSVDAPAEGRLYYLDADGTLTVHVDGLKYGNGVHVDLDANRLLLSEHLARKVWSYPVADGALQPRSLVVDLNTLDIPKPRYAEAGPDGLEIGPDGTLWIAEYGAKRLLGWQPERGLVAALVVDAPYITNIAFGPDGGAALTGSYTNHEPRNRGGIWLFEAALLTAAAAEQ